MAQRPPLPTSGSVDSQQSGGRGTSPAPPSFSHFTGALSKVGFASKRFTVRITYYLPIFDFKKTHHASKINSTLGFPIICLNLTFGWII